MKDGQRCATKVTAVVTASSSRCVAGIVIFGAVKVGTDRNKKSGSRISKGGAWCILVCTMNCIATAVRPWISLRGHQE